MLLGQLPLERHEIEMYVKDIVSMLLKINRKKIRNKEIKKNEIKKKKPK